MKARLLRMLYCFLLLALGAGAVSDGRPQPPKDSARERKATSDAVEKTVEPSRALIEEERCAEAEKEGRAALVEVEGRHGPDSFETARVLYVLVDALWRGGKARDTRDRQILQRAERVASIRERADCPVHQDLGVALSLLGKVLGLGENYEKACACFERSFAIREKYLVPKHPSVADSLEQIARVTACGGTGARM